ncbi:MAG: hypothetical protein IJO45_05810 [Oscillospiraceae bacterium]|nr:hypothetical protein [Oscillospiraceae bacterium]
MIISIQDWIFDVDVDATANYCSDVIADPCVCGYCRNFRSAVKEAYPSLDPLLSRFGSRVDAPEELMPYEPTVFEGSYCISGVILKTGTEELRCDKCSLSVLTAEQTDYETACPRPYFVLRTNSLELPWVLAEDMDEVVSPANEPEYLERMWDRLLQNAPESTIN